MSLSARILLLLAALPFAALAVDAVPVMRPESSVLSLDPQRAVELALQKNFQIEVASYLPPIADEQLRSASGVFDPELFADLSRFESADRTVFNAQNPNVPLSAVNQRDSFDTGLRGLLPWGMTYDAGFSVVNNRGTFNGFSNEITTAPQVSLRQPVLRGFGFASTLAQIRIARADTEISDWQLRQTVIDVVTQVILVYNDLHFSMENLEVAKQSRGLAGRLLQDNIRRAEVGVMSPLDITTARAEVASREDAVILAQRAVRDNQNFLKQLVTNDIERILAMEVVITPPEVPLEYRADVTEGIASAMEWRPEYQQALLDIRRRGINLAFSKNQALPRLDLTGSLRFLGLDNDLGTSTDRAFRRDRSDWSAGAILSIPIPNRDRLGALNAVRLGQARALVDLKRLEQDIVVAVDNAAGRIVTARERIVSTREAVRLAYESLDAGQERLTAGTGTTFEVLELQENLARAEVSALGARADFNRAVAEYERQTGTTLQRRNIVLTP